jgi:hypothetical protein
VHYGHKISFEVDDNSKLIINNPRGILCQQLMRHPIYLLNIIIIISIGSEIKTYNYFVLLNRKLSSSNAEIFSGLQEAAVCHLTMQSATAFLLIECYVCR